MNWLWRKKKCIDVIKSFWCESGPQKCRIPTRIAGATTIDRPVVVQDEVDTRRERDGIQVGQCQVGDDVIIV